MKSRIQILLSILILAAAVQVALAGVPVQLQPLPEIGFKEDSLGTIPLKEYFADPDGAALVFDAESPEDSMVALVTDTTLFFSPYKDWHGDFTVVLRVTSSSGEAISRTLRGKVWPVNDPPFAILSPAVRLAEDSILDVDLADRFLDTDGRIVAVTSDPGRISFEMAGSRLLVRAARDWHGSEQVGVAVVDDSGAVARFSIPVIVAPVNDAPHLSGMPPAAVIQANGILTVDFAPLASDVDHAVAGLAVKAVPQPGVRFRSAGTRLSIMPFARIDTLVVSGVVEDSAGGTAPFSFNLFSNAGFQDKVLSLSPNLPTAYARLEPAVLMNPDGSWDAITMADSAVFLNRYRPDGSQKVPGRALRLNVRDTVAMLSIKRDSGVCFLQTFAYRFGDGTAELRVLDTAFRETARLEGQSWGTLELDISRKRVLMARTEMVGETQIGTLTLYDYALNKGASKRFHAATARPDSVLPDRQGQTYLPYIGDISVAVLPGRYALLWGAAVRTSRYMGGIQFATLSPDLVQSDSAGEIEAYVDDRPDTPVNRIQYFRAYHQWGHVYCLWQLDETKWGSGGSMTEGPTIRILRLDAGLQPASPIRKVSSGKPWYLAFEAPEFLAGEIIVPWNSSDSYPKTPREYYAVHFRPELDSGLSVLVAKDTLNASPKRHLLNGKVHLLSRRNAEGTVVASPADGAVPSSTGPIARGVGGPNPERAAAEREAPAQAGSLRRFDARGRELTGNRLPVRSYESRKSGP